MYIYNWRSIESLIIELFNTGDYIPGLPFNNFNLALKNTEMEALTHVEAQNNK